MAGEKVLYKLTSPTGRKAYKQRLLRVGRLAGTPIFCGVRHITSQTV